MKNDYCIIKIYADTNNEYVVKENLTFDEAQAECERFNNSPAKYGEACMYIIGDDSEEYDNISDVDLLDEDDDVADYEIEREISSYIFSDYEDE